MFTPKSRRFRRTATALFLSIAVAVGYVSLSSGQQAKDAQTAEVTALLKARVTLAEKGYKAAADGVAALKRPDARINIDVLRPHDVTIWSLRLLKAERDLNPKHEDQIAALERHLKRLTELEKKVKLLGPSLIPEMEVFGIEWHRLDAELWLAQAKAKK